MKRLLGLAVLLGLGLGPTFAIESRTGQIHATADAISGSLQNVAEAEMIGNVKVEDDQGLSILADKMRVSALNKVLQGIEFWGSPVRVRLESKTPDSPPVIAQGLKVYYAPQTQKITLSGSAVITQGEQTLKAEVLVYEIETKNIHAQSEAQQLKTTAPASSETGSGKGQVELNFKVRNGS